ncbi:hypothetical protein LLE49_09920 [Alicyclobacillus tolerans]|uniref:hypothetical protein n=1 Tax=Alicyclobacillus tolerans TaxID=90970 RepID=UPI001F3719A7|nr:hypothetical protein [Alicyclobacillus tolerans]MCF8565030.1 hypothetical protein [Alicyclobacillus tolerans]
MNPQSFASHLGFNTWNDLVAASDCVAYANGTRWYVVKTTTWYKWVLWNTKFDLYFNHSSRTEVLKILHLSMSERRGKQFRSALTTRR